MVYCIHNNYSIFVFVQFLFSNTNDQTITTNTTESSSATSTTLVIDQQTPNDTTSNNNNNNDNTSNNNNNNNSNNNNQSVIEIKSRPLQRVGTGCNEGYFIDDRSEININFQKYRMVFVVNKDAVFYKKNAFRQARKVNSLHIIQ